MYNPKENYCSFSPERLFGVNHNYACYLHDRQYRNEVKNRKTRAEADRDFRKTIFAIYKKKGKAFRGFFISWGMYLGARVFGLKTWREE